jgi:hypothetical protein
LMRSARKDPLFAPCFELKSAEERRACGKKVGQVLRGAHNNSVHHRPQLRSASGSTVVPQKPKLNHAGAREADPFAKCFAIKETKARRACGVETGIQQRSGCQQPVLSEETRPAPRHDSPRLWLVSPPAKATAGTTFVLVIAGGRRLDVPNDYLVTVLEGPSLVLCDGYTAQADGRVRVECLAHDPGRYTIRVSHLFESGEGLRPRGRVGPGGATQRARVLAEASASLRVVCNGIGDACDQTSMEVPTEPCRSGTDAGRWVRRALVCGGAEGPRGRALCAVPPTAAGWQWLPWRCYLRAWDGAALAARFGGRSLLFSGDSTTRFIWGAFINMVRPPAERDTCAAVLL